jgi:hypothetical protein
MSQSRQSKSVSVDPLARTFVIPKSTKYERNLLAETALSSVQDPRADAKTKGGDPDHAGQAKFANNQRHQVPGGAVYISSGLNTHHVAQLTNPYTHEVSR